jgi:exodeoxyribonuclease V gamma subunit
LAQLTSQVIQVFTHPQLDVLATHLATHLQHHPLPPLEQEWILVPHSGIKPWLNHLLAQRLGIWANGELLFPRQALWKIARRLFRELPYFPPLEPEELAWRIFKLLPGYAGLGQFAEVNAYLKDDHNQTRTWQLALELAKQYDLYTIYRPEWILAWERGEGQHWQHTLWRDLAQLSPDRGWHRVALQQQFLNQLERPTEPLRLPQRLNILGVTTLPPFYLDIIAALAAHIPITWYLPSPQTTPWHPLEESGTPPLLLSNGTQNQAFAAQLAATGCSWHILPREAMQHDLLGQLRHHLQHNTPLTPIAAPGDKPVENTVEIHSCHSPTRELEVLRNCLWAAFAQDTTLTPGDVAILVPDIDTYAPLIEALFGHPESPRHHLPYRVAARSPIQDNSLLRAFQQILGLVNGRFTRKDVLGLLDQAPIRQRFAIENQELPLIQDWLEAAEIRWGRDAEHRQQLDLPAFNTNSWADGLKRLVLGYALPDQGQPPFAGILPYTHIEGSLGTTLGKLLKVVHALETQLGHLEGTHTLDRWQEILLNLSEALLSPHRDQAADLETLTESIRDLQSYAKLYPDPIPLSIVRPWLEQQWQKASPQGLGTGRITFAPPAALRGLPFRWIGFLGLNAGALPRSDNLSDLNLLQHDPPRPSDNNLRQNDRALFLETLLAAKDHLHLSYIGRRIRDNHPLPPSVLIAELVDTLTVLCNGQFQVQEHPLHPFASSYFQGTVHSYSQAHAALAQALQQPTVAPAFAAESLPTDDGPRLLSWAEVLQFFRHPARSFLQRRLGLRYPEHPGEIPTSERFDLDGLEYYQLKQEWLAWHLSPHTRSRPETLQQRLQAAGRLPVGEAGRLLLQQVSQSVMLLAEPLAPWLQAKRPTVAFETQCGGWHLHGSLPDQYHPGFMGLRPAKLTPKDYLHAWLQTLLLHHLEQPDPYYQIGLDEKGRYPVAVSYAGALPSLASLMELLTQGLTQPLPFAPHTSYELAKALRAETSPEEAWDTAAQTWKASEGHDPAFQRCLPEDWWEQESAMDLAQAIYGPMWDQLNEHPLKHMIQEQTHATP